MVLCLRTPGEIELLAVVEPLHTSAALVVNQVFLDPFLTVRGHGCLVRNAIGALDFGACRQKEIGVMIVPKTASLALTIGGLILIVALPGCVGDLLGPIDLSDIDSDLPQPTEVRSVVIEPDSVTLSVGQSTTLRAIVTLVDNRVLETTPVSFWSSDTTVATVSPTEFGGPTMKVTGRAIGTAWITAMYRSKSGKAKVIVN